MNYINGTSSSDTLVGTSGDDTLYGGNGNDSLDGGAGNDILYGEAGSDAYLFGTGGGTDWIYDNQGSNTLRINALSTNVTLSRTDAYGVTIRINGTNDQITIGNWFLSADYQTFSVVFNDVTWNAATLSTAQWGTIPDKTGTSGNDYLFGSDGGNDTISGGDGDDVIYGYSGNDLLNGGAGNDRIYGGAGNDILDGGAGNDLLDGGAGNDTFKFGKNYGQDTVVDTSGIGSDLNTIEIAADVAVADVQVKRLDNAGGVTLTINGTTDQLTLQNWFASASNQAFQVKFLSNNTIWNASLLSAATWGTIGPKSGSTNGDIIMGSDGGNDTLYGLEGNDTLYGFSGNDTLDGGSGNDILSGGLGNDTLLGGVGSDTLYGMEGNDILVGNAGNDILEGGWGVDTYIFGLGAGTDTIIDDFGAGTELNTLEITDTEILPANITLFRSDSYDLTLQITGSTDQVILKNWFNASTFQALQVKFANGTIWSSAYLSANAAWPANSVLNGTEFGDFLTGTDGADTIYGLGGNDYIYGYAGNDFLYGGAGNDMLNGGAGSDRMEGGTGDDTYIVSDALGVINDTIVENAGEGIDTVTVSVSVNLASIPNIENVRLLSTNAINAIGNASDNILYAGDGNNSLDGGTGNDTASYLYARSAVSINLALGSVTGGSGSDTLTSIENAEGSDHDDTLNGNISANVLNGGYGNDTINGGDGNDTIYGGYGDDTLDGGDGNDTIYGGYGNDTIKHSNGTDIIDGDVGTDTVTYSTATTAITANLTTGGASGWGGTQTLLNIENIIGGTVNDILTGNAANNVINGGTGADTMTGRAGDDTYVVDNATDSVGENANEGIDLVISSITWTLGADTENLQLGAGTINGTGNALDNTIYAGSGSNTIDGGAGIDTLSYIYAASAITITLANNTTAQTTGGSGSDKILNFENLIGSTFNDSLTGDGLNNTIYGDLGNDTLNGGVGNDTLDGGDGNDLLNGGDGNDALCGGNGTDTFFFNTALNATSNVDTITDFDAVNDIIRLENTGIFTKLTTLGTLNTAFFVANATGTPLDADDYILYNTTTGVLSYDADGSGAGAAITFAILGLDTHPTITNLDFTVV